MKIFLWIVAGILAIVIGLLVFLYLPAGQNFVKNKVISYLKNKTDTEISLERLSLKFPKQLELNKLFVADKKNDTLLYSEKLLVDINMWGLLKNRVELNNIELSNIRANVYRRHPDTLFNYQFLVDSLLSNQKKPDTEVGKDSSAALKFNLDKILLHDIQLRFMDDVAGNNASINIGNLNAKVERFDLDAMHYVLNRLAISNTSLSYAQYKPLTSLTKVVDESIEHAKQENQGNLPLLEFKKLDLNSVNLLYDDGRSGTRALAGLGNLSFSNLLLDISNGAYRATNGTLQHSLVDFSYRPTAANKEALSQVTDSTAASSFSLKLDNLLLANNQLKYSNLSAPYLKGVLDYNHLNISGLAIAAQHLMIDSSGMKANVRNGSLKDSSGFVLNELKGNFLYDDKQLRIDNFLFKTPQSYIENTSTLSYTSQNDLTKNPERVKMAVNFRPSVLHLNDVQYLSHAVPASYRDKKIHLTAALNGYLNDLDISALRINGLKSTRLDMAGNIKGLPHMNKTFYNLNIKQLQTAKSDIQAFVPKNSLPADINLPNRLAAKGTFKGSFTDFQTRLNINTDIGTAKINAKANLAKGKEAYTAEVSLNRFNLGYLLKQKDLGQVSLTANLNGRGLNTKTMKAAIKGTVHSAQYNGYTYQNLALSGSIAGQQAEIAVNSTDSNASFNLNSRVGIAGKSPSLRGNLNLRMLDLQQLGFSKTEMKLAGTGNFDFSAVDPDALNGTALLTNLQVVNDGQSFLLDTISLIAVSTADSNRLSLVSEPITAQLHGKFQLTRLAQGFINELNKYYEIGNTQPIPAQRVKFDVAVLDGKLLQNLVPALTHISPASVSGLLDTDKDSLLLLGNFPRVIFDSFDVKNTVLDINNRNGSRLDYNLSIAGIESPSVQLYHSEISGAAANNLLDVNLFLRDSKKKDKYTLGGNLQVNNGTSQFSLAPEKLMLNYDRWQVAPDNRIRYGKDGILVRNFDIGFQGQRLSANSISDQPNAPVKATFTNFKLETLTRYADQDTSLLGGIINGDVLASELNADPKFETNLGIAALRYKKDLLGNASIKINNYSDIQADISLDGVHEIRVSGFYHTAPASSLDAQVFINKIDLTHIESLTGGQIRRGTGAISGQVKASGPLNDLKILGALRFLKAGANVAMLNSFFSIDDETVEFTPEGIVLNTFTVNDSLGQPIMLDGMIFTKNYRDFAFGIDITADNFRAMNAASSNNDLFYGKVFVDLEAHVGGTQLKPEVNFDARINEDTDFTFVIPADDPSVASQQGIVEFIDMDDPDASRPPPINVDSLTRSSIRGLDVSGNLSIDKNAQITIVVDPQNGDALKVKGQADLSVQMDAGGKTSLTGRYEISEGGYSLTIGGLAKREFKIQQGSSVQWTGAPTDANVDITAIYKAHTSPMDLIADQIQGLDQATRTTYRQKMPFLVYLKMGGELLKPAISFELDMPENERSAFNGIVYTRIQQVNSNESELNKQVFALLALNRFVSDNPFRSLAGGTTVAGFARQSVSKMLSEQLNNLASDLIHGVDINFELTSGMDYSTGTEQTRTDLNIGLSKALLNDRLIVTVGNNFALEGTAANTDPVQIASNVNIEYLLSKDGRYRLRAYRRNRTEGIVEGQIIETGVGFRMVVDYNRFKEIFESFKKRNQKSNTGKLPVTHAH